MKKHGFSQTISVTLIFALLLEPLAFAVPATPSAQSIEEIYEVAADVSDGLPPDDIAPQNAEITESGTLSDTVTWTLYADGTLTLDGTGPAGSTDDTEWVDAFQRFQGLIKTVIVAEGINRLGSSIFSGQYNLTNVSLPESLTSVGENVFQGCTSLQSIVLPNSLKIIGASMFSRCSSLKDVVFPENLEMIYWCAFSDCTSLETVTLPPRAYYIGFYAFGNCTALRELTISATGWANVYLMDDAFDGCQNLVLNIKYEIKKVNVTNSPQLFKDATNITVCVPQALYNTYATDPGWSQYENVTLCPGYNLPIPIVAECDHGTIVTEGSFLGEATSFVPGETVTITAYMDDGYVFGHWISNDVEFDDTTSISTTFVMPNTSPTILASCIGTLSSGQWGDGGTWYVDEDGKLGINGTGPLPSSDVPWVVHKEQISSLVISGDITEIGDQNFKDFIALETVVWPDSISVIGDNAFSGCSNLKSIVWPTSLTEISGGAFADCTQLVTPELPNGITSIGDSAFSNCSHLNITKLPDSLITIGDGAFKHCIAITLTSLPGGISNVGSYAFSGCSGITDLSLEFASPEWGADIFGDSGIKTLSLGQGVCVIPAGMFSDCTNLSAIVWSEDLTEIGPYAFANCTSLASVAWTESLTNIGAHAFENCTAMATNTLPLNLTSLGEGAFQGCHKLSITEIPVGITIIPKGCFANCTSITTFEMPTSVIAIEESAFSACTGLTSLYCKEGGMTTLGNEAFCGCTQLSRVFLPESLQTIGDRAFQNCTNLTHVGVSSEGVLYELGSAAFMNCSKLSQCHLPNSVQKIDSYCFYNCTALDFPFWLPLELNDLGTYAFYNCQELSISSLPDGLTLIPAYAFKDCVSLDLTSLPASITEIHSNAFENCSSMRLASLPSSLKEIRDEAFSGCSTITVSSIPSSVTALRRGAFQNCSSITQMTIPDTDSNYLTANLFAGCTGLRRVILPSSVNKLSSGTFKGCNNLEIEVHCPYVLQPTRDGDRGEENTFKNATRIILRVPEEKYQAYIATNSIWKHPDFCTKVGIKSGYYGTAQLSFDVSVPDSGVTACGPDGIDRRVFPHGSTVTLSASPSTTYGVYYYDFVQWTTEDATISFSDASNTTTTIVMPDHDVTIGIQYKQYKAHGVCGDNIIWKLDSEGTLVLDGFGPMNSYSSEFSQPWSEHRNEIKHVLLDPRITTIGKYAFARCALISVGTLNGEPNMLPDGITSIGAYAFANNPEFKISTLPNGMTSIPAGIFANCQVGIFTIPASVTRIQESAFSDSKVVLPLGLPENLTVIGDCAFANCDQLYLYSLPDTITSIGTGAFYNCTHLDLTELPNGPKSIPDRAFYGCTSLRLTYLPSSVTYIGDSAFRDCPNLKITQLFSPVTWIGDNAFYNSDQVELSYLPPKLTHIGSGAFLSSVETDEGRVYRNRLNVKELPEKLQYVGGMAFWNCTDLNVTKLPDGIMYIGGSAFSGCTNLKLTSLPNNLLSIGAYAFSDCSSLRLTDLPSSVGSIGEGTFSGCTGITTLTIPASVSSLGAKAFQRCDSLADVTLLRTDSMVSVPTAANAEVFSESVVVHVPVELLDEYLCDPGWREVKRARGVIVCADVHNSLQIISEHGNASAYGNVSGTASEFKAGEMVTLSAQPHAGYQFLGWTSDDVTLNASAALSTQLVMPASPVTVTANYKEIPKTITAVTSLTALNVEYGTPADELGLPATVQVALDDGTSRELSVTWNTSSYDPTMAGVPQSLFGAIVLPSNVLNPDNFTVSIDVIVHRKVIYKIARYNQMPALSTTYGVSADALVLPAQVTVYCVEIGEEDQGEEAFQIPVTWDTTNYDPTVFGTYTLQGCLGALPGDVENPNGLRPTLTVTVEPIDSWEVGADKDAPEAVIAYLHEDPTQSAELILRVTGTGAMKDFTSVTDVAWATHTAAITQVIVEDGVTSVGNNAFRSQANQPNQLHAVCLGSGLKRIGVQAFANCNQLTSITIPASVESIDAQAFRACTKLNTIAFEHSAGAPLTVAREEKKEAFGTVSKLPTMLIGEHEIVKDIAYWTACGRIVSNPVTSIVLTPDSATMNIGAEPLQLVATVLPEGATNNSITWMTSDSAVARVNSTGAVTAVGIGTCIITATNLDTGISATCSITVNEDTSLTWNITQYIDDNGEVKNELILTGVVEIPDFVNGMAAPWWGDSKTISRITVGEGITAIGDHAFYQMTALEEVLLPESVTSIGYRSFAGCTKMKQITLPSFLETIGERAFYGCGGLTEIVIPESVTTIGSQAFFSCSAARTIVFQGENSALESIGSGAFKAAGNKATTVTDHSMNDVVRQYDWAADSRTVTFIP